MMTLLINLNTMRREDLLKIRCARKQCEINNTPRVPNKQDEADNRNAVRMCVLIAMLNSAMYDLEDVIEERGMWRFDVKYHISRAHDEVLKAHGALSKIMGPSQTKASKQYNALMDVCLEDVNKSILIQDGLEKQYNICVSLCRLVGVYNDKLRSRYKFIPAERISKLLSHFESIPVTDDNIDFIVDSNITIRYKDAN